MTSISFLPIEILRNAVGLAQKLISGDDSSRETLLLLTGVFTTPVTGKLILLPWSPLRTSTSTTIQHKVALDWFLNKFSEAIIGFDEKVRVIWQHEWPQRCFRFLTRGISRLHSLFSKMIL